MIYSTNTIRNNTPVVRAWTERNVTSPAHFLNVPVQFSVSMKVYWTHLNVQIWSKYVLHNIVVDEPVGEFLCDRPERGKKDVNTRLAGLNY